MSEWISERGEEIDLLEVQPEAVPVLLVYHRYYRSKSNRWKRSTQIWASQCTTGTTGGFPPVLPVQEIRPLEPSDCCRVSLPVLPVEPPVLPVVHFSAKFQHPSKSTESLF